MAGYAWSTPSVDDDSIDLTLSERGGGGSVRSPKLDLQIKCHAAETAAETYLTYNLKIKNYNDLREECLLVPKILVVVIVPEHVQDWTHYTESELALRRSGYWHTLRGARPVANTTTVAVRLPRSQPFNATQLRDIMQRIAAGGMP